MALTSMIVHFDKTAQGACDEKLRREGPKNTPLEDRSRPNGVMFWGVKIVAQPAFQPAC
jgi:hypothetical protein